MKGLVIQPHFMPWLGYLAAVNSCNVFVFYDDVKFSLDGWYRRNRVLNSFKKEPVFINAPITKGGFLINEVKLDKSKGLTDTINQLNNSYNLNKRDDDGAFFVNALVKRLDKTIREKDMTLADLNLDILKSFCWYLNIKTDIVVSSSLSIPNEDRYKRVPLICEKLGITDYYNGQSSKEYMKSEDDYKEYTVRGIRYNYWNYNVQEYKHYTPSVFHPRLSALDCILSLPRGEAIQLVNKRHIAVEYSNNL